MALIEITLADLSPVANHLWQSTLCATAVWLLTLALRKNHASVRYWLWLAASVKFLIPFSLLVSIGSHIGWRTVPVTVTAPQWSSVVEDIGRPFAASAPALQAVTPKDSNPLTAILMAVWLCGFAVSVILWLRCWRHMRAARKAAVPMALGLPIPAMSSPSRLEPGVFGVRKPVLLLPEGIADRLTPDQLHAVLAHEMCHVQRRDNLTAAIHMMVEAVFWFYPLVWWIRARLVEERERACDEAVVQSGNDPEVYAEGILSVCKFYVESPLTCVSGISGSDLKKRIVRIVTRQFADELSLGKKVLLAAIGIVVVAGPLGFGLVLAPAQSAQAKTVQLLHANSAQSPQPSVGSAPSFEVASVKPSRSGAPGFFVSRNSPARFTATGMTAKFLIEVAYGVKDFQVSGGPNWIDSEHYDVDAKGDESLVEKLQKLPSDQQGEQVRLMLQSLLVERFKLTLSHETKKLPMYALVIAKNGFKVQQSKPGDTYSNGGVTADGHAIGAGNLYMRNGELTGQGVSTAPLVRMLSEILGSTVVDKTGLSGKYDFTVKWTPETQTPMSNGTETSQPGTDNTPPPNSGVSIFTAIQEQLGLKLESQKSPVEILVIDHIEKPSEN